MAAKRGPLSLPSGDPAPPGLSVISQRCPVKGASNGSGKPGLRFALKPGTRGGGEQVMYSYIFG